MSARLTEIQRQLANRRQQVAGLEALVNQMPAQIVGDLPVGRNRGLEVERHAERSSHCLMSIYNIH